METTRLLKHLSQYMQNIAYCRSWFWIGTEWRYYSTPHEVYINKIQQDATVCRYLFTAKSLDMFRASIAPIIRST